MKLVLAVAVRCAASTSNSNRQTSCFRLSWEGRIWYYSKVAVDEQVFKNIKNFERDKKDSNGLFHRVNVSVLDGLCALYTLMLKLSVGYT